MKNVKSISRNDDGPIDSNPIAYISKEAIYDEMENLLILGQALSIVSVIMHYAEGRYSGDDLLWQLDTELAVLHEKAEGRLVSAYEEEREERRFKGDYEAKD